MHREDIRERRVRRPDLNEVSAGFPARRYGDPDLLAAIGVLQEKNRELRNLAAQHAGDLKSLIEATAERDALRKTLRERDGLLKETHHRVKNNLQVVASLLRLEAGRAGSPGTQATLKEMQGRILSMSLLHETLYQSGTFGKVELGDYLRRLATQLFRSHNPESDDVSLNLELAPGSVTIDQAIPCGLLVNELVTNSLKHGFPDGRRGAVTVRLERRQGAESIIEVSDNGVGLPADLESRRERSLGLQLVADLARQLGGRLDIGPPPASSFVVTFRPRSEPPPRKA